MHLIYLYRFWGVFQNTLVGPWKKDNDFVTHIAFKILNPTDRYVDFEGVSLTKLYEGDYDCVEPDYGKPCCRFPQPYYCGDCVCDYCEVGCMEGFMNTVDHPHPDYAGFSIHIHAFDKDITTMDYNVPYQLGTAGHYHDYIQVVLGYQTGDIAPAYHNIECSKSAHLGELSLHYFNIWITRTGENTWRIDVGIDEEGNIIDQFFFLEEYYYEKSEGKGKKGKGGSTSYYSTLCAGGNFHFTFNLVKESTQ